MAPVLESWKVRCVGTPLAGFTLLTTLTSRDPVTSPRCSGESRYVCSDCQQSDRSVQAKRQKASLISRTYQVVIGHLSYVYEDSFPLRVYKINCRRSGLPGFLAVLAHYR